MERIELVGDRASCRSLYRRVVGAIVEGEPAEQITATMARLDGGSSSNPSWGPFDGAVQRWYQVRRRLAARARPLPPHQVDKAVGVIRPYLARLDRLPAGADVARVGSIDLVDDHLRAVMVTWPERVGDGANLVAVRDEIRASMASLTKARMMLDLGLGRLTD